MSLEWLVVLAFFVLLPLVERLLRTARQQRATRTRKRVSVVSME